MVSFIKENGWGGKMQEFVIKGTIPDMIKVLQNDFDMSKKEAKFFVYVMIEKPGEEVANAIDKEELNAWYLDDATDRYEGQIFHTQWVINFTNLKQNTCHLAYRFLVNFFFSKQIDPITIGAELIYLIMQSIKKVEDTDYCVYARIVESCMGNTEKYFSKNDIVTANKDGKCDYQEEEKECPHMSREENCTCSREKINLAFENLEQENIIKKVGERWKLVK